MEILSPDSIKFPESWVIVLHLKKTSCQAIEKIEQGNQRQIGVDISENIRTKINCRQNI